MLEQFRSRLNFANLMSVVALCVALATGGAYAASQIGSKDIAKNAVRAKHVKANQIATKHIKDGAVTGEKLAIGLAGPQGPGGATGPAGATASATASTGTNRTLTDSYAPVLQADIATPFAGRLMANAALNLQRDSGGGNIECKMEIASSPFASYTALGEDALVYQGGTDPFSEAVPLAGAVDLPGGSYRVRASCRAATAASLQGGTLNAWAAAG